MKNKKQVVRTLLELLSTLKGIPETSEGSIDMEKFEKLPEIQSVVCLLKHLEVNADYLREKGFMPAFILLGRLLK